MKNILTLLAAVALLAGCGYEYPTNYAKVEREDVKNITIQVATITPSFQAKIPLLAAQLQKLTLPSNVLEAGKEIPVFRYKATGDSNKETNINLSAGRFTGDGIEGLTLSLGAYEDFGFSILANTDAVQGEDGKTYYILPSGKTFFMEFSIKTKKVLPEATFTFYIEGVGKEVLTAPPAKT